MKIKNKIITSVTGAVLFTGSLYAQTASSTTTPAPDFTSTYYDVVALSILFLVAMIVAGFIFFGIGEGVESEAEEKASLWVRAKDVMNRSTPIEREHEVMLDHDYDGIKELDNRIPPWFSWLFYVTIVFGFYYLLNYHVLGGGKLQDAEYEDEVKIALAQRDELIRSGALVNENSVTLLSDAGAIAEGKTIYTANCVACHGPAGGGLVGPNLTDEFWIHGGSIKDVFKTIKYGVPAKGMISWQTQLNPKQMQDVASFIISLKGTNPANGKAPEGQKFVETLDTTNVKKM